MKIRTRMKTLRRKVKHGEGELLMRRYHVHLPVMPGFAKGWDFESGMGVLNAWWDNCGRGRESCGEEL